MNDCIFCKIIAKEIPADIVYEDEKFLGFLDIRPVHKGHTLLIPKQHLQWMTDAEDSLIGEIFVTASQIMSAMKQGIGCDYVQLGVVGVEVPHFHIHLIPQKMTDAVPESFRHHDAYTDSDERNLFAHNIKNSL